MTDQNQGYEVELGASTAAEKPGAPVVGKIEVGGGFPREDPATIRKGNTSDLALIDEEGKVPATQDDWDYGDDAGAGSEDIDPEDYAIPFITLMQPGSPQLETIDNAELGNIFNTATEELYGNEITFIPSYMHKVFVEWKTRESGGGFIGIHAPTSRMVKKAIERSTTFGKYSTPDGNDLNETAYVYGLVVKAYGEYDRVLMALASTQIKKYKQWTTKTDQKVRHADGTLVKAPLYCQRYRLSTVREENQLGKWWGWIVKADGRIPPGDDLFTIGKEFYRLAKDGLARVDRSQERGASDVTPDDASADDDAY